MSAVGFFLGLIAVAAVMATTASLVGGALIVVARRLPLPAARRADVALFVGLAPAVAAFVGTVLVALPAVLTLGGWAADHCLQHDHHGHLCPVHLGSVPAVLAAAAAFVGVGVTARLMSAIADLRHRDVLLRSAIAVGQRAQLDDATALVILDGPPTLLHASAALVVASRALLERLSPASRRAALAHEAAHVRRRDGRWLAFLSLAAAFTPPPFGAWVQRQYRQAAEEAADEEAAVAVGGVDVAAAMIEVSRVRLASAFDHGLPANDGGDLEARVRRLLVLQPQHRRSGAVAVVAVFAGLSLLSLPFFDHVHHLAESALAQAELAPLSHHH